MDVRRAFLNAPLQQEICLEIPQGVSEDKEAHIIQLNKAIYGLKQASLAWYKHLTKWLTTSGFQCAITDPCVFWRKGNSPIWIYVHIDDLARFGPNLEDFKQEIKKDFDMKDLGIHHWNSCLQVFRYLFHSRDLSLTFKNNGFNHIITYADDDWGNNPIDRRSISGFTVSIDSHLISWRSKKQQTISHSKTEADYKALSDTAKETTWLVNLSNEIQLTSSPLEPLLLKDSKGAIDLALCDANNSRFKTKHMDIRVHFI
ncbi:hypothetical protein O181_100878 [Austropuccinia psidii MF-1]|uniref:Reverse transcriptase Ty1/copia-type domain-containing protein n=1 Tax=Austropuccinia psidii MF-1 TaxID=1389203 RepID=A0A9Q3JFG0_9BASI|nr:hypothetical protein [Austropuccinia psidii MF-1]